MEWLLLPQQQVLQSLQPPPHLPHSALRHVPVWGDVLNTNPMGFQQQPYGFSTTTLWVFNNKMGFQQQNGFSTTK